MKKVLLRLAVTTLVFPGLTLAAQEITGARISLNPQRCVALHQGQACYQTLNIRWWISEPGDYCLQWQGKTEPLHCFNIAGTNELPPYEVEDQLRYEFVGTNTEELQLVNRQSGKVIAAASMEVAWVYKANSRRKSHWRIF